MASRRIALAFLMGGILAAKAALGGPETAGYLPDVPAECGTLKNRYGPFDYTNPIHFRDMLPVVENAHFDSNVANLRPHEKCQRGKACKRVNNDISYTLRAFPNHHRALLATANYHLRGMHKTAPMQHSVDCYFIRAMIWAPNDATVRAIYGYYLQKSGQSEKALEQYEAALELAPDFAEAHYNLGLLYADLNRYEDSLEHATTAYSLGYPLPGLRNRLERAGVWQEP